MRLAAAARFLAAHKVLLENHHKSSSSSSEDAGTTLLNNNNNEQDLRLQQRSVGARPRAPAAAAGEAVPQHGENPLQDLIAGDHHLNSRWWNNNNNNNEGGGVLLRNEKPPQQQQQQQQLCDPHSAEPDIGILSCGTLYYCAESRDSVLGGVCAPVAADYTSSGRHLQFFGDVVACLDPTNYNCDCTNFDTTTNTGSYACQPVTDFCCELDDGTSVCADVTVSVDLAPGSVGNNTYCYEITSPYEISLCASFAGENSCTLTIDGVECNSCQVLDCPEDEGQFGFDCTNIPASGTQGGCADPVIPIISDFETCQDALAASNATIAPVNATIPIMDNMTASPTALGTMMDNATAPTASPAASSLNETLEASTPVPTGVATNETATTTTDVPTVAPGDVNATTPTPDIIAAPPTDMPATMTPGNATTPTDAPVDSDIDSNTTDTNTTEPPTVAPAVVRTTTSPAAEVATLPTAAPTPVSGAAAAFRGRAAGLVVATGVAVAVAAATLAVGGAPY